MSKRRAPRKWPTNKRKRYKKNLFRNQGGMCARCLKYFDEHQLHFELKPGETNWYRLICRGCHE